LLFVSPVFFPLHALPAAVRPWVQLNPLTPVIEQVRAVVVWGQLPDVGTLAALFAAGLLVAWAGFAWFQKTRQGFADVL
jgi:lipopolysaccharide transport system permease protein